MSNFIVNYNDTYYYGVNETKNAMVFFYALDNNNITYNYYGSIPENAKSQDVSDTETMMLLDIFAEEYPLHSDLPDVTIPEEDDRSQDAPAAVAPVETVAQAMSKMTSKLDDFTSNTDEKVNLIQESINQVQSDILTKTEYTEDIAQVKQDISDIKEQMTELLTAINKLQTFWNTFK